MIVDAKQEHTRGKGIGREIFASALHVPPPVGDTKEECSLRFPLCRGDD